MNPWKTLIAAALLSSPALAQEVKGSDVAPTCAHIYSPDVTQQKSFDKACTLLGKALNPKIELEERYNSLMNFSEMRQNLRFSITDFGIEQDTFNKFSAKLVKAQAQSLYALASDPNGIEEQTIPWAKDLNKLLDAHSLTWKDVGLNLEQVNSLKLKTGVELQAARLSTQALTPTYATRTP